MNRCLCMALAGSAAIALSSCQHCCSRPATSLRVAPSRASCAPGMTASTRLIPQPLPEPMPPALPAQIRTYGPLTPTPTPDSAVRPTQDGSGVRLQIPVPETRAATGSPPLAQIPAGGIDARPAPSALPVGIPQFALAKAEVATGLKPLLDGLDWLQANGYRMVLHVRMPGEDDSADRQQIEKRGLKYAALEVSPQSLSQPIVDEFSRLVRDAKDYPLFVYDRDGYLAGGLWYLHFRLIDLQPDEPARVRAARLGFREDSEGTGRQMWLAIQKLLAERR